ncbi:hypothetical protein [Arsenophonus sp. PmNCSU2021_1]
MKKSTFRVLVCEAQNQIVKLSHSMRTAKTGKTRFCHEFRTNKKTLYF